MIHKYRMNGYNIVIDINSGAVHNVDDVTYDILDHYKEKEIGKITEILENKYDKEDIIQAYEEIKELEDEKCPLDKDTIKNSKECLKYLGKCKAELDKLV